MTPEGRRLALVVASSQFSDKTLQQLVAPGQDAADLARVLADATIGGFAVKKLINRPSHEVRREIAVFFANRKRNDLLLLYFSGHGVKDDDGRLYLATTDTERGLLRATAVPATFVNETMTASRSRRQVLILDCCHSGAFARGMVAKGGESVGIHDRFEGRGRVVLTASNATQYAFQEDEIIGEGVRSVFTHHLVHGLETGEADLDGDGWVSLDELYDYVYERVTDETPKQTPGKWIFDLRGEILIARNPRWVVKPVELPLELQQAVESPFAGVREGAVRELDRLLQGSHPGLALTAHAALTRLVDDDSRLVSTAAAARLATHHDEAGQEAGDKKREGVEAERLAAQKAEAARAVREKAEQEVRVRKREEQKRRAREPLRSPWYKRIPNWAWIVSGVAMLALLIGLGGWAAGWWLAEEPTPTPYPTPTSTATQTQEPTPMPTDTPTATPTDTPTPTPTPTDTPTTTPTEAQLSLGTICDGNGCNGDTEIRPTDGMVMVYVPTGEFEMGSSDDKVDYAVQLCNEYYDNCERELFENELPAHTVALNGFWIDRTEVTNAQFAAFLNERGNQTEGGEPWLDLNDENCLIAQMDGEYRSKSMYAEHPATAVSWYGAVAYCEWVGGQLPTEAEWEYAARGPEGFVYPWGNELDGIRMNFCDVSCGLDHADKRANDGYVKTAPVGSYPSGATWCGALDMAGNVWEWVADWHDRDYYRRSPSRNPTGPSSGEYRVLRGGSWFGVPSFTRGANRYWDNPDDPDLVFGFRCVRSSE
jgi:formylglycine-generating enzyme required for sulfatase activity